MNLPPKAKRVFHGVIFDVYQWEQEMFDGTHETFEMLKRADTVEVIATRGDKIFLTHQSQHNKSDFFALLGGRSEEGEEPLEAAKRELLEESGLASNHWELFQTYQPLHKMDWNIHTFIARDCEMVGQQHLDAGEQIELMECTFDEFVDAVLSEKYWGNELTLDILRRKDQDTLGELQQLLFRK
jgi:ADP-ribose pyrophosphatase